ncbi:MAG: hypothetical protein AVDCRST_MAG91-2322 [uncultured Sphingomonadaceae bacterium]|uniref:Uncharacterized protein n=1 Tax=uncultured Sphingomonadaceae bacterium TaxID=169976 RepID=A0A6J4TH33_9SPHN|nr:MAG: hypothetical protein AVDCRST_MAG91-2322 [uncultured Sphingomonadaceae bacterium]
MGEQPVIETVPSDVAAQTSARPLSRRVLCGGLFGVRGTKLAIPTFLQAAAADQATISKAKEDVLS